MLIDKNRNKNSLTDLWHKVFGDSYNYIELIFKEAYSDSIICFAEPDGEKVASAFYLLKSCLEYKGKAYNGYYLYAAATLPEYRKKGLMSKLIKEAEDYCEREGCDFISLVPSNDGLYSYYEKSGFKESMYCYEPESLSLLVKDKNKTAISAEEYYKHRSDKLTDMFSFCDEVFEYAADCLEFAGHGFYRTDDGYLYIYNADDGSFVEVLFPQESDLKKRRYGMIYPINDELKRDWIYTDIYMNIALD